MYCVRFLSRGVGLGSFEVEVGCVLKKLLELKCGGRLRMVDLLNVFLGIGVGVCVL